MRRLGKDIVVFGLTGFAVLYLIYPSLGVFELIPDAIPVIGSMDEAVATTIVLSALAYYGIDLNHLFGERKRKRDDNWMIDESKDKR